MKKILALVLAVCLFAVCFAGCGSGKGTIVMGCSADFPPYEFTEDDGTINGIDVEIAKAVFEDKLGYKLEIKDMEFKGIIAAVEQKAIDFGMSGMTVTDERKESVDFSDTYATAVQAIVVKKNSTKVKSDSDLANATIGVQEGTTGDIYCTDDFGADHVKQYDKYNLAIQALLNGQVDCCVIDDAVAKSFAAANEELTVLDTAYCEEEYAIAFNKGDAKLREEFNKGLAELKEEGKLDEIIAKYIHD